MKSMVRIVQIAAVFLVFLGLFFAVQKELLKPDTPSPIQGGATNSFSVGITIIEQQYQELNATVPSNGTYSFTDPEISTYVRSISGLTEGWSVNTTFHNTTSFPAQWTESEPPSTVATSNRFGFLDTVINATTTGGSYTILFQVPRNSINSMGVSASNIRLFAYENSWTELSTTVVNANADPTEFSATATHFSKFMIAERTSSSQDSGSSGSSSGGGGGGGGRAAVGRAGEIPPAKIVDLSDSVTFPAPDVSKPRHLPGTLFDVIVSIPQKYQELSPTDQLLAEIRLINIGDIGLVTVDIEYNIIDAQQQVLFREYATKTVETEAEFLKEIELPPGLAPGDYTFVVILRYEEDTATAGYQFKVLRERRSVAAAGKAFLQKAGTVTAASSAYWVSFLVILFLFLGLIWLLRGKLQKKRSK